MSLEIVQQILITKGETTTFEVYHNGLQQKTTPLATVISNVMRTGKILLSQTQTGSSGERSGGNGQPPVVFTTTVITYTFGPNTLPGLRLGA